MNVNKKKLADIFGVDVRTITAWLIRLEINDRE
ncbi:terminase small subunit [Escherichia coli]|nr:terminase small subunit [Escherichia coli]MCS1665498.1 terminase small subunit [Escherichia coli]